jgi:protein-S-isoprenylcysteine O-methyltransferase Ste14
MLNKIKGSVIDIILFILTAILFLSEVKTANIWLILGIILLVFGLLLWIIARYQLGQAFSVTPQAKFLVNKGVYSKISHPIYTASVIATLGLCLIHQKLWLFGVWIALIIIQFFRAKKEEKVLTQKFGDEYLNQKKRTWF